jgi:hypothetical protein
MRHTYERRKDMTLALIGVAAGAAVSFAAAYFYAVHSLTGRRADQKARSSDLDAVNEAIGNLVGLINKTTDLVKELQPRKRRKNKKKS